MSSLKKTNSSLILERALVLLFTMSIIGYPVAGLVAVLLDLPSGYVSIPFRLLVLVCSVFLFLVAVTRSRYSWFQIILIFFLVIYLFKLVWLSINDQSAVVNKALFLYIVAVIAPVVAVMVSAQYWSSAKAMSSVLVIGSIIIFLSIYLSGIETNRNLWSVTGRLSFDTVNPISLGHVAVTVLIAIYCKFGQVSRNYVRLLLCGLALAALWLLFASGSKGPLLALFVVVVIIFFLSKRKLKLLLWAFAALPILFFIMLDSSLFNRIESVMLDASTSHRVELIASTLQQIVLAPMHGSSFIVDGMNIYPHNVILEAAMTVGIPITCLFLILFIPAFNRYKQAYSMHGLFLYLIFIQYFIGSLLSGAIYASAALFVCMALLLASYKSIEENNVLE